jgi:hypothetical protein
VHRIIINNNINIQSAIHQVRHSSIHPSRAITARPSSSLPLQAMLFV